MRLVRFTLRRQPFSILTPELPANGGFYERRAEA